MVVLAKKNWKNLFAEFQPRADFHCLWPRPLWDFQNKKEGIGPSLVWAMKIKIEQREDYRYLKISNNFSWNLELCLHIFTLFYKMIFTSFLKWPGNSMAVEFFEGRNVTGSFNAQCVTRSLEPSLKKRKQNRRFFSSVFPHTQLSGLRQCIWKPSVKKEVDKHQMITWSEVFIFQSSQQLYEILSHVKLGEERMRFRQNR